MNAEQLLAHYERIAEAPDAISRLRQFVLDLAVRGKLVEQEAWDEPTAQLIEAIATQKGNFERPAHVEALPIVDEPFPCPAGWLWSTVGEICTKTGSGSTPRGGKDAYQTNGIPFLRSQNVHDDGLELDDVAYIAPETHTRMAGTAVRPSDLLLNITGGSMGRCCRVEADFHEANVSQHVAIIRPALGDMSAFLHMVVLSPYFQGFVFGEQTGAGRGGLPKNKMDRIPVPLPPLAEQHRIVAKVDELMALCDRLGEARKEREAARDRLTAASLARLNAPDPDPATFTTHARFALDNLPTLTTRPDQIKRLRQTILNLAVRGKLVRQDASEGPASALLNQIAVEVFSASKAKGGKAPKPLPEVDASNAPFELPRGWAWARFPELGYFGRGKSKHRPRNDPALYLDGVYPFIQTGDVARSNGAIYTHTNKYNDKGLGQSMLWPAGTMCITIAANIADSGILTFDACFPDSVVGFRPASMLKNARYFEYFVRTAKANLLEFAPATAQKNINLEILTQVLIPLPPLAEQARIVDRVDELMSLCDRLESSLATSDETRQHLLEALLQEALEPAEAQELELA